ncbi:MAG: N-acetylglucosamine-6-phosphate deacetylase [Candidatus Celerinatantimonas neptuna]|nr:MAG: N-acetylglucosamine-6-phosphate deacetylase [Candidatus Celerinatantimonas neptuna]
MKYALTQATLFDGEKIISDHALILEGNQIESIVPETKLPSHVTCYAMPGQLIAPAFIDLQLNGCGGVMFNGSVSEKTLETMHQANLKSGTTTFLPTLITTSQDEMNLAFTVASNYRSQYPYRLPGLHLEGPFISTAKKGIHTESFIRPLTDEDVKLLIKHANEITLLTVAPENASPEQIKELSQNGIRVSLGHSNASYEQTQAAFNAGAKYATHVYNAMSGLKGREPGVLGAIFDSKNIYGGIIVDGLHIDYACVRIAKKLLKEHLYLITDATAAAGSDIHEFEFVGRTIHVENGHCIGTDGTLGGSMLTMNEAVRNCIQHVGIEKEEVLRMASLYPARAIGLDNQLGTIARGFIANLVLLDPQYNVTSVIEAGELIRFE